jgi:phosphoribosylanthranilate isomerase
MFVKVCGITNREDAECAVEYGAGAVGFIFHPGSPRYVRQEALARWIDCLPASVWRVGVFVDRPAREVERVCRELRLDVAQLHGSEAASDAPSGVRVWKAFRVSGELHADFPCEALLLDGAGSGQTFDWRISRRVSKPVVLAGGLSEENVERAMEQARPWGVDVCSSLETYPGKKDHARMARFLKVCQPALSLKQ